MPSKSTDGGSENDTDRHTRIARMLRDPASYEGLTTKHPDSVEVHETHGALVFLAGDVALKIKRPVKLAYLDFSTAERRSVALRREFIVNRANAPEFYREVLAITEAPDGRLALGGTGKVVEHALVMRRFPPGSLISELVAARHVPSGLGRALGDMIAAMHACLTPVADTGAPRRLGDVIANIGGTFGNEPCLAGDGARFAATAELKLQAVAPLLQHRVDEGRVARCHGDLHLANLVWIDDRPIAFDAIEFDEELATIDVLYDLAFTLMDLERTGLATEANVLLNRWLWRSGRVIDLDGLEALPLFLATRAGVRAMVTTDRAHQIDGANGRDAALAEATTYLRSGLSYLTLKPPVLVAVGGLSGTGKSTLAAALAPLVGPSPGAVHLRSDLERKALRGAGEFDRLAIDAYQSDVTQATYARVVERARHALGAGHAVVADAVFSRPDERAEMAALAASAGVPFLGLWLDAPADTLKARVAARRNDASDATVAVVEAQLARGTGGTCDWKVIDAAGDRHTTLKMALTVASAAIGATLRD